MHFLTITYSLMLLPPSEIFPSTLLSPLSFQTSVSSVLFGSRFIFFSLPLVLPSEVSIINLLHSHFLCSSLDIMLKSTSIYLLMSIIPPHFEPGTMESLQRCLSSQVFLSKIPLPQHSATGIVMVPLDPFLACLLKESSS